MEVTKTNVIELAKSMIKNNLPSEYSDTSKNETALRNSLVALCGGSTKIDLKTFRKHKFELFEIIEEIVPVIVTEGLKGDEFFMQLVDYRNKALGDDIDFYSETTGDFIVSTIAYGTTGLRRQRLVAGEKVNVPTMLHGIKVFEHLSRFMAGLVDWSMFIDKVGKAMVAKYRETIYDAFSKISASTVGMKSDFITTLTPDKAEVVELIERLEAATGGTVTIFGTLNALNKLPSVEVNATAARDDMYNMGYYGRFGANNVVRVKQVLKAGTTDFMLDQNKVWFIPSGVKPIWMLDNGEGYIQEDESSKNADLTMNYLYTQDFGATVMINGGYIGIATFA